MTGTATSAAATSPPPVPTTASHEVHGALSSALAFVGGFAPWIVYWILVGNVRFTVAVLVALGLSVVVTVVTYERHHQVMVLEAGSTVTFAVFVVLAFTMSEHTLERWLQPLGNLGLLLIVLVSVLIGMPFTRQYARQSTPKALWDQPGFVYVCAGVGCGWA